MDGVKLFQGDDYFILQKEIDVWVKVNKPEIKNTSICVSPIGTRNIAITYHIKESEMEKFELK